ncbi:hypothetical protein FGO68_gene7201 [Halteria grandinella]|uniref:Uncharacterized protein n=1 Tax=Halteria grandinella TaxID=5974 RepID=A0A8J8P074_HALGN|nr:hypothetical protein FGO68_gene7201 [Halteria grandinella]
MNEILTIRGRSALDMVHIVTQSNRRFALIKEPERDMRGFILQIKRVTPTIVRGETLIEVVGKDRFIADVVQIPQERQGLYSNESEALKFANGRIIKDEIIANEEEAEDLRAAALREINEKLRELETLFNQQYGQRALPEIQPQLRASFGEFPRFNSNNNFGQISREALTQKLERQSIYVLSHLELQNSNKDLIFSTNGVERLNACLTELRNSRPHMKLFVWEPEVSEKKKESHKELLLILALVALLFLAKYFRG